MIGTGGVLYKTLGRYKKKGNVIKRRFLNSWSSTKFKYTSIKNKLRSA